jgi:hypothetical protein
MSILNEHVAIIATRDEWARVAFFLLSSDAFRHKAKENPETFESITNLAGTCTPGTEILDAITIATIDTILRLEKHVPPVTGRVKILKSERTWRDVWGDDE